MTPRPVGSFIGPYEVLEWIGSGGMGDVYRARDARLTRQVAVKLLPDRFAAEPERLKRFEREARAAGQLDHPNILTVHDVGCHEHLPYLVTELLHGTSLRERIRRGRLPPSEVAEYARQMADGLAAAHARGIVHRDLKPENLFITRDHRVKILDFGVAKLAHGGDDEARDDDSETSTAPGAMIGTTGYMSPEQARGEPIDARSDIFSLGAVLYEMLTGRAPFARATAADTQAAILKEEPAPLPRSVASDELAAIVMRCLEKSCETRFQSARDLSFALSRSFTIPAPGRAGLARHWTRVALRLGACGVAIALILAAVNRWPGRSSTQSRFTDARFTRLTDWPGTEGQGEVSPDGRFVAFLSDRDRPFDVWFGRIGTGEFRNLTADTAPVRPPGPVLKLLSFAGDGSSLWSGAAARSMLLPLAGGAPRPFLGLHSTGAAWSPDGARLAYFDNGSGDPLFVADGSGSDPRLVFVRSTQGLHTHNPVWSPDGEWIYFLHGPSAGATFAMDIWRVRPSGDDPEQLTHVAAPLNFLTWVDQRTLLFVMREDRGPTTTLWTFDIPSRQAYRLLAGVEEYRSLSASRDGHRLVATVARPSTTLSRVPLVSGRLAERRDVQRVQTGTEAHAPRFGRSSLFFLSRRGSGDGLWQWQDGHSTERWRGSDDPLAGPVAVAPDERSAAVLVRRGARARLAVVALDGSGLRTLSPSLTPDGTADWSPDGRWIVTSGSAAGATGLFKVPVADGVPVQLVSDGGTNPIWSPDGQLIAYLGPILTGGVSRILGVTPSGAAVSLPTVHARPGGLRFLKDGTGIVYQSAVLDFHLLDLASGTTRQLTNLGYSSPLMAGRVFDVSADGTAIVFDDLEEHSDLVLIDLP